MGPMGPEALSRERIALNQSTFRQENERIEATAETMALLGRVPFICECGDAECAEIVRLTLDEYEAVREHSRRFFNFPGHEALSIRAGAAVVVANQGEYVLVDKIGIAGDIAEETYNELGAPAAPELPRPEI
jgi:ABC-type enterochelin transport system ATPase subunit